MDNRKRFEVVGEIVEKYNLQDGCGVEIGVFRGKVVFYLLKNFPQLQMVAVDPWKELTGKRLKHDDGFNPYVGDYCMDLAFIEFVINSLKYKDRLRVHRSDSISAAQFYSNSEFNFVFIDGDHRESFVKADIVVWLSKIKVGGILMGHDIDLPSVKLAVDFMFGKDNYDIVDNIWTVQVSDQNKFFRRSFEHD